jgi:hypothetical protein
MTNLMRYSTGELSLQWSMLSEVAFVLRSSPICLTNDALVYFRPMTEYPDPDRDTSILGGPSQILLPNLEILILDTVPMKSRCYVNLKSHVTRAQRDMSQLPSRPCLPGKYGHCLQTVPSLLYSGARQGFNIQSSNPEGGENGSQIGISRILLYIPPALTNLLVGMTDFVTQNKGLHGLGVRSVI